MTEQLTLIFAGKTSEGEKIVLYKQGNVYHLLRPEQELQVLSSVKLIWWEDYDSAMVNIRIESAEWSGLVRGSMKDLMEIKTRK